MKKVRWDGRKVIEKSIKNSVLSLMLLGNINTILVQMARVYLAIGGDSSLRWDTENKIEIVADLERRMYELVFSTIPTQTNNFTCWVEFAYPSVYESKECAYTLVANSEKEFQLMVYLEIDHGIMFDLDFMRMIKRKELYRVLRSTINCILCNPIVPMTTSADIYERFEDYWEDQAGMDDGPHESIIEVREENKQFKKLFPYKKYGLRYIKRLDSARKRMRLTRRQKEWFDKAFEFLYIANSIKINDIFREGSNLLDEDFLDNMVAPGTMILATLSSDIIRDFYVEEMDGMLQSGNSCPCFVFSVKNGNDIENVLILLRFFDLMRIVCSMEEIW